VLALVFHHLTTPERAGMLGLAVLLLLSGIFVGWSSRGRREAAHGALKHQPHGHEPSHEDPAGR
jgi:hypothetical protein